MAGSNVSRPKRELLLEARRAQPTGGPRRRRAAQTAELSVDNFLRYDAEDSHAQLLLTSKGKEHVQGKEDELEKNKREREQKEEDDRASKKQKGTDASAPAKPIPLWSLDDGPSLLTNRKLCLERVKCLTTAADEQVLETTDPMALGTELAVDLGQAAMRTLFLTKRYANLADQREKLLSANSQLVVENGRLTGERDEARLTSIKAKQAVVKSEDNLKAAQEEAAELRKAVETRGVKIDALEKQLEQERAEMADKVRVARRQVLKDFLASADFARTQACWYNDGFEDCKEICSRTFPGHDYSVVEPEDDTAQAGGGGDPAGNASPKSPSRVDPPEGQDATLTPPAESSAAGGQDAVRTPSALPPSGSDAQIEPVIVSP